eukprot:c1878_g1_i1 orf=2-205(-)
MLCECELGRQRMVKRPVWEGVSYSKLDVVGPWYGRHNGLRQTIAALYGSLEVLKYIVKYYISFGGDID